MSSSQTAVNGVGFKLPQAKIAKRAKETYAKLKQLPPPHTNPNFGRGFGGSSSGIAILGAMSIF